MNLNCKYCNKEFISNKSCKSRTPKYCSKKCYAESLRIHIKCKLCNNEIINKHSVSISKRIYCSNECRIKARKGVKLSEDWKIALSKGRMDSDKCKGPNLYNWKGGNETIKERRKQYFYNRKSRQNIKLNTEYLNRLYQNQNCKCFYCDEDLKKYKAIEHLTPLFKGGDNQLYNIVYSCKSCNSKKNVQTLEQYAIINKRFDWLDKFDTLYASTIS